MKDELLKRKMTIFHVVTNFHAITDSFRTRYSQVYIQETYNTTIPYNNCIANYLTHNHRHTTLSFVDDCTVYMADQLKRGRLYQFVHLDKCPMKVLIVLVYD